jgi:hypothetical protein
VKVLAMNREHMLPFIPLMRGKHEELESSAQRVCRRLRRVSAAR